MFEDLDFTKLKLPIEPKNLIYIYLAYKLINNLDKLNIPNIPKRPAPQVNNNFIFLIIMLLGGSFLFLNNILNRISFSSISVENLSAQQPKYRRPCLNINSKCPVMKNEGRCPMRKCPLFSSDDDIKCMLEKCLEKCKGKNLPEKNQQELGETKNEEQPRPKSA